MLSPGAPSAASRSAARRWARDRAKAGMSASTLVAISGWVKLSGSPGARMRAPASASAACSAGSASRPASRRAWRSEARSPSTATARASRPAGSPRRVSAHQHRVQDRVGEQRPHPRDRLGGRDDPVRDQRLQQFPGEERVAAADLRAGPGERGLGVRPAGQHHPRDRLRAERPGLEHPVPGALAQPVERPLVGGFLAAAHRDHERGRQLVDPGGQVREVGQRRPVGPLGVVHLDQQPRRSWPPGGPQATSTVSQYRPRTRADGSSPGGTAGSNSGVASEAWPDVRRPPSGTGGGQDRGEQLGDDPEGSVPL